MSAGMMIRRHGIRGVRIVVFKRLHRPYASMNWIRFNGSSRCFSLAVWRSEISAPCRDTPGECVKSVEKRGRCQRALRPSSVCEWHLELLARSQAFEAVIADPGGRHRRSERLRRIVDPLIGQLEGAEMVADAEGGAA